MQFHEQRTSALPLAQPHLDLRLLSERGGEADLQAVVTLIITRGVHAAYGLRF